MKRNLGRVISLLMAALAIALTPVLAADETPARSEPDDAELDRAHAERLRRAIEKNEAEQAEYARRRDSELGRQGELTRLQARIATLERDESLLHGQLRQTETQLIYMRNDPADMSAHARRGELQSRASYCRSQLNQIVAEKQTVLRRLSDLRESRFR
jgi:hypothetical protein